MLAHKSQTRSVLAVRGRKQQVDARNGYWLPVVPLARLQAAVSGRSGIYLPPIFDAGHGTRGRPRKLVLGHPFQVGASAGSRQGPGAPARNLIGSATWHNGGQRARSCAGACSATQPCVAPLEGVAFGVGPCDAPDDRMLAAARATYDARGTLDRLFWPQPNRSVHLVPHCSPNVVAHGVNIQRAEARQVNLG